MEYIGGDGLQLLLGGGAFVGLLPLGEWRCRPPKMVPWASQRPRASACWCPGGCHRRPWQREVVFTW